MEAKDIYTILISICVALLSAYVAYGEYRRRQPNLVFFHRFRNNSQELFLEIMVTNASSNSIDLIEAGYYLGDANAFRRIPMKTSITLDSGKSAPFLVSWSRDTEYTMQVEDFHFKSSTGKTFVHSLEGSITEELKLQLFIHQTPEVMFEMEKLQNIFNGSINKAKDACIEAEELINEFKT